MKETAALFSALSDETRLRILSLLVQGELCVCHLEEILQMPQSKVSRHLMVLRHAGLVSWRREVTWMYYSLPGPKDDLHARVIDCLRTCLQENPQVRSDVQRIAAVGVANCCEDREKDLPKAAETSRGLAKGGTGVSRVTPALSRRPVHSLKKKKEEAD